MLLLAALLLVDPPVATPAPPAAATAAADKKICRREEELGTMFAKRTCRTQAEWNAIDAQNAREAERFGNNRDNNRGLRPGE